MESNDSPEISDRGKTSDIPGLPSGATKTTNAFNMGRMRKPDQASKRIQKDESGRGCTQANSKEINPTQVNVANSFVIRLSYGH